MTALEEKLFNEFLPLVKNHNCIIDELHYVRKGKEFILQVYVEREDLSSIDLDDIVIISEDLSQKLDELNIINDNYCLDVSTSGAEKPIKDFSKFPLFIGKYMEVKIINPIKGLNMYVGTLEAADEEKIVLSYKEKTRTLKVEILIANINKAKLTVKI